MFELTQALRLAGCSLRPEVHSTHNVDSPIQEQLIMPITTHDARRSSSLVPLVGALLVLAGCASVTPIGELRSDPSRYDGKTVRIEGRVRGSIGGLGVGAYEVQDETGTLPVLSETGDPPPTGSKIGVKGRFQALLTLGLRSLAVLREQSRSFP
jgi:hypothetical protein